MCNLQICAYRSTARFHGLNFNLLYAQCSFKIISPFAVLSLTSLSFGSISLIVISYENNDPDLILIAIIDLQASFCKMTCRSFVRVLFWLPRASATVNTYCWELLSCNIYSLSWWFFWFTSPMVNYQLIAGAKENPCTLFMMTRYTLENVSSHKSMSNVSHTDAHYALVVNDWFPHLYRNFISNYFNRLLQNINKQFWVKQPMQMFIYLSFIREMFVLWRSRSVPCTD